MDALKFQTAKSSGQSHNDCDQRNMRNELLSSTQLSRLADVPVGQIIKLANAGKLSPVAVNRSGKLKNLFFLPSQADEVRQLVALELQPTC